MAPPDVGSTVPFIRLGKITRHNDDDTVNVKFDSGRGRPYKVPLTNIPETRNESFVYPPCRPQGQFNFGALKPSPPSLPESSTRDVTCIAPPPETSRKRSLLSWTTFLTVTGAIALGISHGVGSKLVDEIWPIIRPLLGF